MVSVRLLPREAADDLELVSRVVQAVNDAYIAGEAALWSKPLPRTHDEETRTAIADGAVAVAECDGRIVGSIQTKRLNDSTWWFGALAVHPDAAGLGAGAQLVDFAETQARMHLAPTIQLERLDPVEPIEHFERIHSWYSRLGYVEVNRYDVGQDYPEDAKFLTCACDLVTMHKQLPDS